ARHGDDAGVAGLRPGEPAQAVGLVAARLGLDLRDDVPEVPFLGRVHNVSSPRIREVRRVESATSMSLGISWPVHTNDSSVWMRDSTSRTTPSLIASSSLVTTS